MARWMPPLYLAVFVPQIDIFAVNSKSRIDYETQVLFGRPWKVDIMTLIEEIKSHEFIAQRT
jgi:hypothetical protein